MLSESHQYVTQLRPLFAERSAAGWTSSIAFPVIEEKTEVYNQTGNKFSFDYLEGDFNTLVQNRAAASPSNPSDPLQSDGQCGDCAYYSGFCPSSCAICNYDPDCLGGDDGPGGGSGGGGGTTTETMRYVKTVRVRMGDGATHEFRKSDAVFGYCNGGDHDATDCEQITPDNYGMFLAVNGSGMKLERTTEGSTLFLPNGSRYLFPTDSTHGYDGMRLYQATDYFDANGNRSTFSENIVNNTRKIKDSLGREVKDFLPQNFSEQEQREGTQQIVLDTLPGQTQTYQAKWLHLKPVACDENNVANCGSTEGALEDQTQNLFYYTANTCFGSYYGDLQTSPNNPDNHYEENLFRMNGYGLRSCNPSTGGTPSTTVGIRFNPVVLAEITLPNQQKYKFKYNQYGEITKITYPTGSVETFKYARIPPMNGFNTEAYDQANRGVVERKVYNSDGVLEQRWKYSATIDYGNYTNVTYIITTIASKADDPNADGIKTERYLHADTGRRNNFGFTDPHAGKPKEEKTYDETGVLRSRNLTEWIVASPRAGGTSQPTPDPRATRDPRAIRSISIVIEGNKALATMNRTEYDETGSSDAEYFSHLNVKRKKGYHYKALSLNTAQTSNLNTIAALFNETTDVATVSENDYLYEENYKSRGLTSLSVESRTINPADDQVLVRAQTFYDNLKPSVNQNYPASYTPENYNLGASLDCSADANTPKICWKSPGSQYLGNPTTTRVWDTENNIWVETHTRYDIFGNGVKVKDAVGNEATTEFDSQYKYAYPTRLITPAPDPTGTHGTNQTSQTAITYDFMTGLSLTVTDDFGQTTKTEYIDELLRPTKVFGVNFNAPITETIYDDSNLKVKVRKQIDENNWAETETQTDSLGRAVKTKNKDSQGNVVVRTKYDKMGHATEVSNPYRVDSSDNPTETVYWSKTDYDELGRVFQYFAPAVEGATGTLLGMTHYDVATGGDSIGVIVETTDAAGRKGRAVTNALAQLIRVDEPSSTNTLNAIPLPDATPQPTPTPGGNGCYEMLHPDPNCQASLAGDSYGSVSTYYKYNALGKMTVVTQGAQKRYFKYDSLGRLIRVRQPEQEINASLDLADADNSEGHWTAGVAYDVLGNLKRATGASGVNIIYEYDKAGRQIKRCYTKPGVVTAATECSQLSNSDLNADTPTVESFYDGKGLDEQQQQSPNYAKGRLTKVKSSISETRYTLFNNFGKLLQSEQRTPAGTETIVNAVPRVSKYEYNLSGALVQQTYPSGRVVRNTFESDGDLSQIQSRVASTVSFKTYAGDFSYTPSGAVSQVKLGNGRWETAKYNIRQQTTEIALGTSAADTSLWKVNYEYGELDSDGTTVNTAKNTGSIAKQTISFAGLANPFVQTYKYDSLERLTEARETAGTAQNAQQTWKQNFSYDRFGNRLGFEQTVWRGQAVGNETLPINKFTHPTINPTTNRFAADQGYIYDKNGNLTIDAENRQFYFNGENKQIEVRNANGATVGKYFYDGAGKRVKKLVFDVGNGQPIEETIFVYDGMGKLVAEYSTQSPPVVRTTKYSTADQLGSPRVISDQNGDVISRRDFMPFGEELSAETNYRKTDLKYGSNQDDIRQKFTGYQKDTETQLDFAEARMYNNQHARFTAVDPLLASGKGANPQSFNRYVYVMNNPLEMTDSNGQEPIYTDGNGFFTTRWRQGLSLYEGPLRKFKAKDGYYWVVAKNYLERAQRWRNPTPVRNAARKTSTTGQTNTGDSDDHTKALIRELGGKRGPALQTITTGMMAGSALIAGIPFIAPAVAASAPSIVQQVFSNPAAVNQIGSAAVATEMVLLNTTPACGGGGPCGGGGGGLSPELSRQLSDIYSKYPKDSGGCQCAANETLDAFRAAGIDGKIVRLYDNYGARSMYDSQGNEISKHGFHETVQVGDRFYDALTGPEGATWDEYLKLWDSSRTAPYLTPAPRFNIDNR